MYISKPTKQLRFNIWPKEQHTHLEFDTPEGVYSYFRYLAYKYAKPLYFIQKRLISENMARLKCRVCKAEVSYKREKPTEKLHCFYADLEHEHPIYDRTTSHLRELYKYVIKFIRETPESQIKRPIMQIFSVNEFYYDRFRKRFTEEEIKNFNLMEHLLYSNGYNAIIDWYEMGGTYPKRLVAVTRNMKNNYKAYCDLVKYYTLDTVLKNQVPGGKRYVVGVWSVVGSSNRNLIAGIAAYYEYSEQNFQYLFDNFFKLQDNVYPQTLETDNSLPMLKLIGYLKGRNKIKGHIFEVSRLIQNARHNLISKKAVKPEYLSEMENIVNCAAEAFSKESIDECIERMRELPIKKYISNDLINSFSWISPVRLQNIFIGVANNKLKPIRRLITSYNGIESTIIYVFRQLTNLDYVLTVEEEDYPVTFNEVMESTLKDYRLGKLRENTASTVFQLFIKMYLKSLSHYPQKVYNPLTNIIEYEIEDVYRHKVSNWYCTCYWKNKTGVPCSHIISCANSTAGQSYLDLVKPRWLLYKYRHPYNKAYKDK